MSCNRPLLHAFQISAVVGLVLLTTSASESRADFPIVGFDSFMLQKGPIIDSYGAMGTFNRADPNSPNPDFPNEIPGGPFDGVLYDNGFDFFEIHAQIVSQFGSEFDLSVAGGVGGRFYEASGLQDPVGVNHDVYGMSFDPADYWLDVSYKLGPNNDATRFDISFDQHDGYGDGNLGGTQSQGEQFTFQFTDIVNRYNSGTQDSDGFVTIRRDITELPNTVGPDPNVPWDERMMSSQVNNDGDSLMDFGAFEGGVRNGIRRVQLKSVAGPDFQSQEILNIFVKSVKLVPKNPEPEVARIDGDTGFTTGFTDPSGASVVDRANGNLVLNFVGNSGAQYNQVVTDFDGTQYGVEVTAKLLPGTTSSGFRVVAKDLDGNDDGAGQGGEEVSNTFNTADFNETDFSTVFIPLSFGTITPAFGFANSGDGSIDDFNLYQFQVANNGSGASSVLNIEIESIKLVPIPSPGLAGDFDGNGRVDGLDFLFWQRGETTPPLDPGLLAEWENNYGNPIVSNSQSVPEPSAFILFGLAAGVMFGTRRQRRYSS